jgi:hypothetical protein
VEVIFLRGAEADLLAAWMRYEEILPGLGDRFEAEVDFCRYRERKLAQLQIFLCKARRKAIDHDH